MDIPVISPNSLGSEFTLGPDRISLKLGPGLIKDATDQISLISGSVNSNGQLIHSTGLPMASARLSTGLYQIGFAQPLPSNNYMIHLTVERPSNGDDLSVWYTNVLAASFSVEIRRQDNGGTAGVFRNNAFNFLVIPGD